MLTGKIDLGKIDDKYVFNGAKGRYLDIVLIETPNDKFGNSHMIVQGLPKEARDRKERGAILGNAKQVGQGGGAQQTQRRSPSPKKQETDTDGPPF